MSHLSKAWLLLVCVLSYFFLGQAGCQTLTSQDDITYMRSDLVRMRRDIEEIKQSLNSPASGANQDILRNQAAQREALIELHEGQQRLESRTEESSHQMDSLKQEVTNLKLNLVNQMEALRMEASRTPNRTAQPAQQPTAPLGGLSSDGGRQAGGEPSSPAFSPSLSVPSPPPVPSLHTPPVPSVPSPSAAPPPLSLPEAPSVPQAPSVPSPDAAAERSAVDRSADVIDYTKLYDTAYEDYVRQSYSLARSEFEEYLRRFPETDLADNAQYWIGECFYAEGKYDQAADAFKKVIEGYPTGNKVPRAMLKAGYAYLQVEKDGEAKAMFQQVVDAYPLSSEADQAKIKIRALE